MADNVILRPIPDGSEDELVALELPPGVDVGHEFAHAGSGWRIVDRIAAAETPLAVRGTSAWVAVPR